MHLLLPQQEELEQNRGKVALCIGNQWREPQLLCCRIIIFLCMCAQEIYRQGCHGKINYSCYKLENDLWHQETQGVAGSPGPAQDTVRLGNLVLPCLPSPT